MITRRAVFRDINVDTTVLAIKQNLDNLQRIIIGQGNLSGNVEWISEIADSAE